MSKEKNDLTLKIFALVIAIILWGFVIGEENPPTERECKNIPVSLNNISSLESQNLVVTEPVNPTIDITIVAKRKVLSQIDDSDILAAVDLAGYEEGTFKVPVIIELPNQVRLVDNSAKDILFKFEKIIRKEVPIVIETIGELPDGYVLGEGNHKPHSIYIEGPRSLVDSVFKVVASVELTDRVDDISINVPLKVLDKDENIVRGLDVEKASVDVFIPVYKVKEVPIDLQVTNLDDKSVLKDLSVIPEKIQIKGRRDLIDGIASIKTKPVSKADLKNGLELELIVPEGITILDKKTTKLKIGKNEIVENLKDEDEELLFEYSMNQVDFKGLSPGIKLSEESLKKSVQLSITSTKENLKDYKKEDFRIEGNLQALKAGVHDIKLSIESVPDLVLTIIPDKVKLELVEEE